MLEENSDFIYERFMKFTQIAVFFLILMMVLNFYQGNFIVVTIDIIVALLFLINLSMKYSNRIKIFLLLFIGMLLFIYLLYNKNLNGTGLLWSLSFPAFSFLLNNKKGGFLWTSTYGTILFLVFFLQYSFDIQSAYLDVQLFKLIVVYMMSSYLIYVFQKEVDLYTSKLAELNNSLENRVEEEVQRNKRKDAILSIQAKQVQMGEMVSMIAHQWRQPLNAVSAAAIKLKLENELGLISYDKINESSDFIQNKTQDMSEIINTFLEFSKPVVEESEFILSNAIEKSLSMIQMQFNLHSISIEVNYENEVGSVQKIGSENLFEQVLLNLFMNMRDAFDEYENITDKKILILVDKFENVYVKDNAGGIPASIVDRVFNPYFTTKEEGKGTGLGLYMSRKIMRTHFNGDLIHIPIKGGSCFEILFDIDLTEETSDV